MKDVRVFYSKVKEAKYISHLDLMRTISRAIKKSGVSIWYTEGFNPHIYITFALPLSLGHEGLNESFDIRLIDEEASLDEVKEKLTSAMPINIIIKDVSEPNMKTKEISFADYSISLKNDNNIDIVDLWNKFINQESILTLKRTKKKTFNEIDIKPDINTITVNNELIQLKLPAGSNRNINPSLVMDTFIKFLEQYGYIIKITNITRLNILNHNSEIFK